MPCSIWQNPNIVRLAVILGLGTQSYARFRVRGEQYPAILPQPGSSVEGMLLRGLTPAQLDRLDEYEGSVRWIGHGLGSLRKQQPNLGQVHRTLVYPAQTYEQTQTTVTLVDSPSPTTHPAIVYTWKGTAADMDGPWSYAEFRARLPQYLSSEVVQYGADYNFQTVVTSQV